MDRMDDIATLGDTMIFRQAFIVFAQGVQASVRRRLQLARSEAHPGGANAEAEADSLVDEQRQSSEKQDRCRPSSSDSEFDYWRSMPNTPPSGVGAGTGAGTGTVFPRSSTASSSPSTARHSYSSSMTGRSHEETDASSFEDGRSVDMFGPKMSRYEVGSGLRWNRIVPATNLFQSACREAEQPQSDGALARSLCINAISYCLGGLPDNLTHEEITEIRRSIPSSIIPPLSDRNPPVAALAGLLPGAGYQPERERTLVHRAVAYIIVAFFVGLQMLLPFLKRLAAYLYELEQSYRPMQSVMAGTMGIVGNFGRGGQNLGYAALNMRAGKFGDSVPYWITYFVEGTAGGFCEGVGEGMVRMGVSLPYDKLESAHMRYSGR
ncbi:hypothetical protein BO70DRAFT_359059 [Aspergillus heteromorphus CBS 117.55]|uniref:Uncharacterized protein n=1 Tax=Aspergillus heteromorphus CBS 117.55 TaxID=1448321 RepID=A0A317WUH6_9EURO|nr:uncharacterized protein BO70DRAFT_359059 [Aspergillus heteromorphus CBS 117.55]PWY90074.1 hypothetical protein BO70DRAFT_359059 [Aspergillus heteromorphus CBS 117.55]